MQLLLTVFCIIPLILIIASSSNIFPFKSGNDVDVWNNTRVPSINDNSLFLSIGDKSLVFSSLLQTISAQEQGDRVGEGGEEQDKIREDCEQDEHFDSEIDSCIPDEEKDVCDDDRDNDNDARVDLEDSECLPNDNEQEQQQQEEDNYTSSNNNVSLDSSNTDHKPQKSSQNLTGNHSTETTTTTNNKASTNELQQHANATTGEDANFSLNCHPAEAEMVPGAEDSITCTIENKTPNPIELILECSGLEGTGIECSINGERPTGTTLAKEMSDTNFSVIIATTSSPAVPPGSYPFTISAEECINSDFC